MNNLVDVCKLYGRTGVSTDCNFDVNQIDHVFLAPKTYFIDTTVTTTSAAILAKLVASAIDDPNVRVFPIMNIKGQEDETEENAIQNTDFGEKLGVFERPPILTFTLNNGLSQFQQIRRFAHNKNLSMYVYYKGGMFAGKRVGAKLYGMPGEVDTKAFKQAGGSTVSQKKFTFRCYDVDAFVGEKTFGFWQFNPEEIYMDIAIHGVKNVTIEVVSASSSSVVVRCFETSSGVSMGRDYETQLELPAAWDYIKDVDGAEIVMTSVQYNKTAKTFSLNGTSLVSAHLALKSAKVLAALTPPLGSGVTGGFESDAVAVTIA